VSEWDAAFGLEIAAVSTDSVLAGDSAGRALRCRAALVTLAPHAAAGYPGLSGLPRGRERRAV
jgi:hypothetical protein